MYQLATDSPEVRVPIRFTHSGRPAGAPADGAVASSDEGVLKAALSDDKAAVILTVVGPGTASISYGSGALSASLEVEVTEPAADAVEFDPDAAAPVTADAPEA